MKCDVCGRENPPNARFCRECGISFTELEQAHMKCDACGRENPPDARFCRECGKSLAEPEQAFAAGKRFCPKCGAANGEEVAFCMKCGASMKVSARNEAPILPAADTGSHPSDQVPQHISSAITRPQSSQSETAISQPEQTTPASTVTPVAPPGPDPTGPVAPADSVKAQASRSGQAAGSPARKTSAPLLVVAGLVVMAAVIAGGTYLIMADATPAIPPAGAPETQQARAEPTASPETESADIARPPEAGRAVVQPSPVVVQEAEATVHQPPAQQTRGRNGQPPSNAVSPNATASRPADNYGVATPPMQSPAPRESKTQPAAESTAAQTSITVPPRSVPAKDTEMDWRGLLARDIDKCAGKGFVDRVMCIERARWKYCHPDRWGKFTECPNAAVDQQL